MSGGRNVKFVWQEALLASGIRPIAAVIVGIALAAKWNGDNNHPFYSVADLMKATTLSERTVERALRTLQDEGWLAQTSKGGKRGSQGWASRWRMTFPNPSVSVPNPSLLSAQPVTSDAPVDLPSRPISVDHSLSLSSEADGMCPWAVPDKGCTCHPVTSDNRSNR